MKVKIGIVGLGFFSDDFIGLFHQHPDVEEVVVCDLVKERVEQSMKKHGLKRGFTSMDEMLEQAGDLNCIGIFTQRHLHSKLVLQALKAGKHVFSAVPIACTVEEIGEIIEAVKETRLVYMTGETCYYYPCAMYCRKAYREGKIGKFLYGESQYYHDISEMYVVFEHSGGKDWRRDAGIPPMFYPTHSVSMLFSAVDEYALKVSCMGFRDNHEDQIYGEGKNHWDNPFSNETAIFQMSGGGVARINEFRRVGLNKPSSYITCMYGDKGAYEGSITQHTIQQGRAVTDDPTIDYVSDEIMPLHYLEKEKSDAFDIHRDPISVPSTLGYSAIHPVDRLPKAFRDIKLGGHNNSHPFLVDDFVRAVVDDKLPPNNAWDSARYMIPGIVAHESALRGGEVMDIPDFGDAPADWERLTYEKKPHYED